MDIIIQARRFYSIWYICLYILPIVVLVKCLLYGIYPFTLVFTYTIEGLGALLLGTGLASCFMSFKKMTILLTEDTLKASEVRHLANSITVSLSEIEISKNKFDIFQGFEVSTREGQGICLRSFYYGRKNKKLLIKEIESRKLKLLQSARVSASDIS